MEQEVAGVGLAQAHPLDRTGSEGGKQLAGGFDRVVGHTDGAGEDVGGASGEHGESGRRAGQPVGRLVQCPVPTEDDNGVEAVCCRALCQAGGMTSPVGLLYHHLVVGRKSFVDDDAGAGGHRRGRGVYD
jgi:hypothetical protein